MTKDQIAFALIDILGDLVPELREGMQFLVTFGHDGSITVGVFEETK